jgi:hypothetical protein
MIEHFDDYDRRRDPGQQQVTLDICSDILSLGGYMTHMALDWRHHPNTIDSFYYMFGQHDHLSEDYSIRLVWRLVEGEKIEGRGFRPSVSGQRKLINVRYRPSRRASSSGK